MIRVERNRGPQTPGNQKERKREQQRRLAGADRAGFDCSCLISERPDQTMACTKRSNGSSSSFCLTTLHVELIKVPRFGGPGGLGWRGTPLARSASLRRRDLRQTRTGLLVTVGHFWCNAH
ncbi:hypothetical protein PGTUg99_016631 [Puccinia graminis f. sp. tritici]|uniref:Uncharacterized protein n=1 Tax=Puccinia graminis f. sp. tritici TaxID=56615 RepID=A0A5B0PWH7_PUCGR|nr:hypothetical protein PGTUg99_016631 [Puccinia graminis f. sp. tritici]